MSPNRVRWVSIDVPFTDLDHGHGWIAPSGPTGVRGSRHRAFCAFRPGEGCDTMPRCGLSRALSRRQARVPELGLGETMKISKGFLGLWLPLMLVAGCGDGSDGNRTAPSSPTRVPTASPTPSPVAGGHDHLLIGSHHAGGGMLMVHGIPADGAFPLSLSECLGGTGADCEGGTAVFSGSSPAFETVASDEAEEHLQPLADGTEIFLELIEADPDLLVKVEGVELRAGEEVPLGVSPFHAHAEWLAFVSGGVPHDILERRVTLRLIAPGSSYEMSAPFTLVFTIGEASDHHPH